MQLNDVTGYRGEIMVLDQHPARGGGPILDKWDIRYLFGDSYTSAEPRKLNRRKSYQEKEREAHPEQRENELILFQQRCSYLHLKM